MTLINLTKTGLLSAALAALLLPAAAQTSTSTPTSSGATTPTGATTPNTSAPVETGKQIQNQKTQEEKRIGNGMQDGQLTSGEAQQLENKERALNKEERQMKNADGGQLTTADRAKLQQQQKQLSGQIYSDKHNDVTRSTHKATGVDGREFHEENRIGQGVNSGQLTAGEASRLEAQHNAIKNQIHQDRVANGGHLTAQEKKQINGEQTQLSKKIYKEKHNAHKR